MHAIVVSLVLALILPWGAIEARAQNGGAKPSIAIAPVTSINDAKKRELQRIEGLVVKGLESLGTHQIIGSKAAEKATRKARKPELRTCEGDAACLGTLGTLVGSEYVVFAELGGLGDAQLVYLKLVRSSDAKEMRSTTLEIGGKKEVKREAKAAATRLVDPNRYVGRMVVNANVDGATIFLDGHKVGTTPSKPISVFVGSHALRVTHPEHRDFVRFVDIEFGTDTPLQVEMKQIDGVEGSLAAEGVIGGGSKTITKGGGTVYGPKPWYRKWYVVAGGAAAVFLTSAIIMSGAGADIDADTIKNLSDL